MKSTFFLLIYFNKSLFKSFYNKLKENLENKGITIFNIKKTVKEIKKCIKKLVQMFYYYNLWL